METLQILGIFASAIVVFLLLFSSPRSPQVVVLQVEPIDEQSRSPFLAIIGIIAVILLITTLVIGI
jgi:hypothetical protein